jgi:hypothetical protein
MAVTGPLPTTQAAPVVQPSGQTPCGDPGCRTRGKHHHGRSLCGLCGGRGCGGCGGLGSVGCGDPGCKLCGHGKSHGCKFCGGKGCLNCLAGLHGKLASLLHLGPKVDYFVGAGGPVPLTPGYVPYVVTTRSPRDFFAFPPMNPFDP